MSWHKKAFFTSHLFVVFTAVQAFWSHPVRRSYDRQLLLWVPARKQSHFWVHIYHCIAHGRSFPAGLTLASFQNQIEVSNLFVRFVKQIRRERRMWVFFSFDLQTGVAFVFLKPSASAAFSRRVLTFCLQRFKAASGVCSDNVICSPFCPEWRCFTAQKASRPPCSS